MSGQSRSIEAILKDRLEVTLQIAEANTTQLRLNQKASGMMVLDLKDERDGVAESAHEDEQARNDAARDANLNKITDLEKKLSALDEELETVITKER
ncbi:hypothetical protein [Antarctobacter heliothermus]|uniref:Uncharacterized protein n=1 Tax=Antarctobacter heliothermus TaxID=74033 RepID=A0A239I004_9RHOB|nr:hypothetical protein [Antarctobacter heliothermus]SNS86809.1 hypothetical protein SAMN04488078_103815 [Antarctobacter heliothermus]